MTEYDRSVPKYIAKIAKCMSGQRKVHISELSDPISIMEFLETFNLVCDTNAVHEETDIWLFHF